MSLLPEDAQWLAQWDRLVEGSRKVLRTMDVAILQNDIEGGATVALAQAITLKARPWLTPPIGDAKTIAGKALRADLIRRECNTIAPEPENVSRLTEMIVRVLAVYGLKDVTP